MVAGLPGSERLAIWRAGARVLVLAAAYQTGACGKTGWIWLSGTLPLPGANVALALLAPQQLPPPVSSFQMSYSPFGSAPSRPITFSTISLLTFLASLPSFATNVSPGPEKEAIPHL